MRWKKSELDAIVAADDLHVSPLREDGKTYGTPTWIWAVEVGGELYVRAYNGLTSRWYQAARRHADGRIRAAGQARDVHFEAADGSLNDAIDEAYRAKYSDSPYLAPMIGPLARAATMRISPR
jgi:hypothetical protein